MKLYERQSDESLMDYADRLIENKKEYDLDNAEIYDLIFDTTLSSDEARKRLYGCADLIQELKKEGFEKLNEDEIFAKLEKKKLDIYKERVKLSTIRNDLNKQIRDESRKELILEEIKKIIPRTESVKFAKRNIQDNEKEYVLTISDIHYGQIFESINNEYSVEIVKKRFETLLSDVIDFVERNKVEKLYVINLGDSLHGLLRISDLKKMQIGLLESVISFARFLGDWLIQLGQHVSVEYYQVAAANHSDIRLFDQRKNQIDENLEWLILNYLHDYLHRCDHIHVVVPSQAKDYIELEINGFNFICLHGHQCKNLNKLLSDLSMLHGKIYDYALIGHYHSGLEKPISEGIFGNRELLIAPSIVGSDPYSDSLMLGTKSAAKLYTFDKYKGKIQSNTFVLN